MNYEEIKNKLNDLLEEYDKTFPNYAMARADYNQKEDLKKRQQALIAERFEGSEALKNRMALTTEEYLNYLKEKREVDQRYYNLQAKIKGIEMKIEVYRSFLSMEKNFIGLTR